MNFQEITPEPISLPEGQNPPPKPSFEFQEAQPLDMAEEATKRKIERSTKPIEEPQEPPFDAEKEIITLKEEVLSLEEKVESVEKQEGPEGPPGLDGEDADETKIVASVLKKVKVPKPKDGKTPTKTELKALIKPLIPDPIPGKPGIKGDPGKPGKPGKDGSEDTGKEIVEKINELEIKPELQIDFIHIRNFPWHKLKKDEDGLISWGNPLLTVSEIDGSPSVSSVTGLIFSNGAVTDNGDGTVTIAASAETLAQTLVLGNVTGGTNLVVSDGDLITGSGGQMAIDFGNDAFIAITTDGNAFTTPYITLSPTNISLASLGNSQIDLDATSIQITHNDLIQFTNATAIRFNPLTASTVPYLDASKNLVSSAVTPTELGYLSGVTSAIQTQIDALNTAVTLQGTWDASAGTFPGGGTAQAGYSYIVSVGGTVDSQVFVANDRIVAITDNASTTTYASNWHKLDYTDQVLSVAGKTGAVTLDHGTDLAGLTDDDHTQYLILAGRTGATNNPVISTSSSGAIISLSSASGGGGTMQSTTHATKGIMTIGSGNARFVMDEANGLLGISGGTNSVRAVVFSPAFNNDGAAVRGISFNPTVESNTSGFGGVSMTAVLRPGAAGHTITGFFSASVLDRAADDATSYNATTFNNVQVNGSFLSTYGGTLTNLRHLYLPNSSLNGGSGAITNLAAIRIDDQTIGGTSNRGIEMAVTSGSGKHNLYVSGTADNYLEGLTGVGTTTMTGKFNVDQSSTTAAIPVLVLDQADISEEMIEFITTIGTGNAIEAVGAKVLTTTHFVKVTIPGGLTRYFPVGTIA